MTGRSVPSIISADVDMTGSIRSTGELQVDGVVSGNIDSVSLTIGETGSVIGDVRAEVVTVRGKVKGKIFGKKVMLASSSRVEGDIVHQSFNVETGAVFEGMCRHAADPLKVDMPLQAQPAGAIEFAQVSQPEPHNA